MKKFSLLILIVVVVVGGAIYLSHKKNSTDETNTSIPSQVNKTGSPTSESNVTPKISLISRTPREAIFSSNVPLSKVTLANVRVYTTSASVGSSGEADDISDDQLSVSYDAKKMTITMKDISPIQTSTDAQFGAFGTGCASCTHNVEFTDLKTTDGAILPNVQIEVY